MAEADAFVIGAPVYFGSPAGGAISFMDRLFFSTLNIDKTMKVGASVVTCRRGGNTASYDVLNKYFTMCGMPVASSQYWNMVYGGSAEEVKKDAEGLQTMRTLGRNMAIFDEEYPDRQATDRPARKKNLLSSQTSIIEEVFHIPPSLLQGKPGRKRPGFPIFLTFCEVILCAA